MARRRKAAHTGERCEMCGQQVPIDADGRCPLGHQVREVAGQPVVSGRAAGPAWPAAGPGPRTAAPPALPVFDEEAPPPPLPARQRTAVPVTDLDAAAPSALDAAMTDASPLRTVTRPAMKVGSGHTPDEDEAALAAESRERLLRIAGATVFVLLLLAAAVGLALGL